MILKLQSTNHALPNALHLGSVQEVGRAFAFDISGKGRQVLMFWVFHPKIPLLELHDMLMQDRTCLCKRDLPTFLELMNLVFWLIWQPWWNAAARSHVLVQWIASQVCSKRSFPARPSKIRLHWREVFERWCIVFGVVVEISEKKKQFPLTPRYVCST